MTNPVNADQLRVTVEMGDDYRPSESVAAALDGLAAALSEESDGVSGFAITPIRSFLFDSSYQTGGSAGDGSVFPKVEYFSKVETFNQTAPLWKW
jgi:hypothetical protein